MTAELRQGSELAGYRLELLVARGGMGLVYKATQRSLERPVALKLIAPELAGEEEFRRRFLREARLAAALEHPHVLPVYEAGEAEGVLYLAMRLVEGESLAELLRREAPLAPARATLIVGQLAEALAAAHEAGLVHRDVKPANVLLARAGEREHPYLCDFGIARRSAGTELTERGGFLGSVSYAAPEQIRGEPVDHRSDLYSLGCLLYECLTGAPPFRKEHDAATLWAQLNEPPPLASATRPELDDRFDGLLARALAKDPGERFQSAAELAAALVAETPLPLPRRPAAGGPSNLPTPASSFLGREAELAEVEALLTRPEVRLLTLTGPGGVGKSRLALEAATRASGHFPDGVFWVPLASLRDHTLVVSALALALDLKEDPGRELAEVVLNRVRAQNALILLDNAEHLLPEVAPELSRLVRDTDTPTWLITSREHLQLQAEHTYPVPTLEEQTGIELFLERSAAAGAPLEVTDAVGELCARLDFLPLALELAAVRSTLFSPEQLLERLSQRLDLLSRHRDAEPRQQTLRATIEWSHELLSEEERRLLRSLSVFVGGCTYEAAEEVCGASPDTLQSLLAKSLLRRRDDDVSQARYWMLETIREYAAEQLAERGETNEMQDRHLRYFVHWAERVEPELKQANQRLYLDRLEADHHNLRAALDHGLHATGEIELAARLAAALLEFWDIRCYLSEARACYAALLEDHVEVTPSVTADLLLGAALMSYRQGDQSEAIQLGREAAEAHERAGSLTGAARALSLVGGGHIWRGELEAARRITEESVVVARASGDDWTIAAALGGLAEVRTEDGDDRDAEILLRESLRLFTVLGDRRNQTIMLANLGWLARVSGSYENAESLLVAAAAASREFGDDAVQAFLLVNLAEVSLRRERYSEARLRLQEAILLTRASSRNLLPRCFIGVALLASVLGETETTARLLGSAEALLEEDELALRDDEFWRQTLLGLRPGLADIELDAIVDEWRRRPVDDAVFEALSVLDRIQEDQAVESGRSAK